MERARKLITVRLAGTSDLEAMNRVFAAAAREAWPHIIAPDQLQDLSLPARWRHYAETPPPRTHVLVAEIEGRVCGFVITRPSEDDDAGPVTGEIDAFYAHPEAWGTGAAQAMMHSARGVLWEAFETATLWTEERNYRPRRFYKKEGWRLDRAVRTRTTRGTELTELRYRSHSFVEEGTIDSASTLT